MNRIRLVGLALVAVCAISVTTTASAGAGVFLSTVLGKLLLKALTAHKFQFFAGTVECSALTASAEVTSLKTLKQREVFSYTGCKAFGLAATISPAEYEFNADGTVAILKAITIKAVGCLVTIPGSQTVGPLTYLNKPAGEIEIEHNATGMKSSGAGAACEYAEENKGTYTGKTLAAVEGGKLSFDP